LKRWSPVMALRDAWWHWRVKPGAEACGAWVRVVRDQWAAQLEAATSDLEVADASMDALDSIYSYMAAHGFMEVDAGALDGPTLPLQPYPEVAS
jgi:hypothetical protein